MNNINKKALEDFTGFLKAKDSSKKTIATYLQPVKGFLESVEKPHTDLTQQDIINYLTKLDKELIKKSKEWEKPREGISSKTKQTIYCAITSFAHYTKNQKLLDDITELRKKGNRRGSKIPIQLTNEEMIALVKANIHQSDKLNERNKLIVLFLYGTGVRNSELTRIRVDELPLTLKELPPTHIIQITGKGGFVRRIVIPHWLLVEIKRFVDTYHKGISEYLFYSNKTFSKLTRQQVWGIIKTKAKSACLPDKKIYAIKRDGVAVFPHALRSTMATNLSDAGENLLVIQTILGHANPNTTQCYVKISNEILSKAKMPVKPIKKEGE